MALSVLRPLPLALLASAIVASGSVLKGAEVDAPIRIDDAHQAVESQFAAFLQEHGRTYQAGSEEYRMRLDLFKDRLSAVESHNGRADRTWKAGVNALADRTAEELQRLRGYRHGARSSEARSPVGLVGTAATVHSKVDLPKDWNWKHLNAMKDVKDQGGCGSCWAVSSATALRAHAELYQRDRTFSVQQIISCTPNPRSCGGAGGCKGATAELAMDYVAKIGLVTEETMKYKGKEDECPVKMKESEEQVAELKSASFLSMPRPSVALPQLSAHEGGGAAFGMVGWRKIPENKAQPLLQAVYEGGPVVVSVAASAPWNMYSSGILGDCQKEAVINHAVVLVGYGEEGSKKYWTIQNSWGPTWGEGGFMRLTRADAAQEEKYCGWDEKPQDGTGCEGGPAKVYVCGQCGILYDNVIPTFRLSEEGWWARQGNRTVVQA